MRSSLFKNISIKALPALIGHLIINLLDAITETVDLVELANRFCVSLQGLK